MRAHERREQFCATGTLFILIKTIILSVLVIISGRAQDYECDSNKILFNGEQYRLFTSIYAVRSFRDVLYLIFCLIVLSFLLPSFERRVSTIYMIFHFYKVNLIVQGFLILITFFIFQTQGVRNWNNVTDGIYPYTMVIFLRDSLIHKDKVVFSLCSPVPIDKRIRGYFIGLVMILFAPQFQPAILVYVEWFLTRWWFCQKCLFKEGPLFSSFLKKIQRYIPRWLGFIKLEQIQASQQKVGYMMAGGRGQRSPQILKEEI